MTPTEPKQKPQSNAVGPQKSDMTPTWGFSVSGDAGTRLASAFFPLLLFVGTAVAFLENFIFPYGRSFWAHCAFRLSSFPLSFTTEGGRFTTRVGHGFPCW